MKNKKYVVFLVFIILILNFIILNFAKNKSVTIQAKLIEPLANRTIEDAHDEVFHSISIYNYDIDTCENSSYSLLNEVNSSIDACINGNREFVKSSESISIDEIPEKIYIGEAVELKTNISPENDSIDLTYESSDTNVARVNEQGVVRAVGEGTAIITVTTEDEKTVTCTINAEYSEIQKAFKEEEYSYYMRGATIQYNTLKANCSAFSPEDATSQNTNYMICSAFPYNIYNELFNIKIAAYYNEKLTNYAKDHINDRANYPEIIGYGKKDNNEKVEMKIYNDQNEAMILNETNNNLNIENISKYLKIR